MGMSQDVPVRTTKLAEFWHNWSSQVVGKSHYCLLSMGPAPEIEGSKVQGSLKKKGMVGQLLLNVCTLAFRMNYRL